ncbi:MAG: hypothetical protein PHS82_13485 [Lachnospiraceae bacterium]|nr:hypothetical protein [Lachnospiraceae bacterium]
MKISIINGSPKLGKSTSELIVEYLTPLISKNNSIEVFNTNTTALNEGQLSGIICSDTIIFAFPLYVDSIPSNLLRLLIGLEKRQFPSQNIMVYCVVNNGFFEGKQNHIAVKQIKSWCAINHLIWGQGIGIGAGEMLPFLKDIPLGHGPNKNIGNAIKQLSFNILTRQGGEDLFISPNWPRFLWKVQSSLFVWYPRAKSNGLKKSRLFEQVQKNYLDNIKQLEQKGKKQ